MATLTQLSYAVALDRYRHFGRAAQACYVSQPTLSMQIQKLEEELGVSLFDRSKQPIIPTRKGKEIIARARRILSEVQELEYIGKKKGEEPQGEFRLGVIPTLAPYLVPLFLTGFSRKYPMVELFIHEMKTQEIIDALREDRVDAGLLITPLGQPGIRERFLFYEPFYLFVSKDHPLYKCKKIREDELEREGAWILEEGHCFRNQMLKLCSKEGQYKALRNVSFESGNIETLKRLVMKGSGYTLVPYLSVIEEKDQTRLNMIKEFQKPVPSREVSLVFQREQLKSDIISALATEIEESVPKSLPRSAEGLSVIEI